MAIATDRRRMAGMSDQELRYKVVATNPRSGKVREHDAHDFTDARSMQNLYVRSEWDARIVALADQPRPTAPEDE